MPRPLFSRMLVAFGSASLAAVVLGAAVCATNGVPSGLWMRNLAAWVIGLIAAAALARSAGPVAVKAVALLVPIGLAATLLNPGLEGVHRWLVAGPVRLNAAMLLLPLLVVATAAVARHVWWWAVPGLIAIGILTLQPDASEATALALAICSIAAGSRSQPVLVRGAPALVAVATAAASWTRHDPLAPVAEVEGIIQLAATFSPVLAALALILLVTVAAIPFLANRGRGSDEARRAGVALSVLFVSWIAAPAVGAFPAPFVGIGLSPILGAWIGVGLLASLKHSPLTFKGSLLGKTGHAARSGPSQGRD